MKGNRYSDLRWICTLCIGDVNNLWLVLIRPSLHYMLGWRC